MSIKKIMIKLPLYRGSDGIQRRSGKVGNKYCMEIQYKTLIKYRLLCEK